MIFVGTQTLRGTKAAKLNLSQKGIATATAEICSNLGSLKAHGKLVFGTGDLANLLLLGHNRIASSGWSDALDYHESPVPSTRYLLRRHTSGGTYWIRLRRVPGWRSTIMIWESCILVDPNEVADKTRGMVQQ